jgi:hypothetical protein
MKVGESRTLRNPRNGKVMGTIERKGLLTFEVCAADGSRLVANRKVCPEGRFAFETYEAALGALRYYRA